MASVDDKVKVTRPDGSETTVSRRAYEGVYQYRDGYTLVDDQPNLSSKTRPELDDIAVEKGIDPADFSKKADLIAAIEGA